VILPGLDRDLAEAAWAEIDAQHPQASMKRLLDQVGVPRAEVRLLDLDAGSEAEGRWRRRVINEALRPPDRTADWRDVIDSLRREASAGVDALAQGLAGLSLIETRHEEETAAVAALLLRETLETPGKTAALICPDASLARRVSARLRRWGIVADSSAGTPLALARAARLAALLARASVDPLDPVTWLALAKYPLTRLGGTPDPDGPILERLERQGLRGPRPRARSELLRRLAGAPEAQDLAERLGACLDHVGAPFKTPSGGGAAPAAIAARALAEGLERLAQGPGGGAGDLWTGAGGEALARLLSALMSESDALPPLTASGFLRLLEDSLAAETLRAGGASHPRLKILGVLEARLVFADRVVLAGLEEGVWPQGAQTDLFLSRPMRAAVGLPPPERRIGLSAHDFAQAACAPEVALLVSQSQGGAPTVPSRWIWRLKVLAKGGGVDLPGRPDILAWARSLDGPVADPPPSLRTAARPEPRPPVSARPRQLGVTEVETWIRDPYALYARKVLNLRPLAPPDEEIDARARGEAVHRAFELFARTWPDALPDDAEARFAAELLACLEAAGTSPARLARERALAPSMAAFAIGAFERQRRPVERMVLETRGAMTLEGPAGPFTLTAKADRLEVRGRAVDVLDFKTGQPPTGPQVRRGLAPQLTLTAAIVAAGGFAEIGPAEPGELVYVRVRGGREPGKVTVLKDASPRDAVEGLMRRIAAFDRASEPYRSNTAPRPGAVTPGDYDHLARVWEWRVIGEEPDSEAADGPDSGPDPGEGG
jgi:ATP-dependent helicase/nuclease subunit B